nr:hypothetical protein [Clostridia bacterium]
TEPPVEDVNYEGRNMSLSGRINPTDSNNIELHLEWTATQKADSPYATVTVKVFLDCYDIYINSRDNSVISINGEEKTFPTKIISINNNKLNSVELHSESVQILSPLGETVEVPVSAMFYFGGKYGSKTFDWLKVSGTITLKDTSSLVPEKPVTPNEN